MSMLKHIVAVFLLGFTLHAYSGETININVADADTLATAAGIGSVRAQAIVEYRQANGPFKSINDLVLVSGIGAATVEKNKSLLTVEPSTQAP